MELPFEGHQVWSPVPKRAVEFCDGWRSFAVEAGPPWLATAVSFGVSDDDTWATAGPQGCCGRSREVAGASVLAIHHGGVHVMTKTLAPVYIILLHSRVPMFSDMGFSCRG